MEDILLFLALGVADAERVRITIKPCDRLQCCTHWILPPLQEEHRSYEKELFIEL